MLRPDENDPLKNRRLLAMLAAFNGFFVFPVLVIFCAIHWHLSDGVCHDLLHYMGIPVLAPICAYLYSAHKQEME